jgi:hypothetical protein
VYGLANSVSHLRLYLEVKKDHMSRQSISLLILFLLSTVTFVSAFPQYDLVDTSYNESDIPLTQTRPVVPAVRVVRPKTVPIVLPEHGGDAILKFTCHCRGQKPDSSLCWRHSDSCQELLCTFLI